MTFSDCVKRVYNFMQINTRQASDKVVSFLEYYFKQ